MKTILSSVMALVFAIATTAFAQPSPDSTVVYQQCGAGNAEACMVMAERFKTGQGVPQNVAGSLRAYKRACELGLARACPLASSLGEALGASPVDTKPPVRLANANLLVQREAWYWLEFNNEDVMAYILNGQADQATRQADFKAVYYYYQGRFHANCPSMVPAGSPGFKYETVVSSKNSPDMVIPDGTLLIRPEYYAKTQQYGKDIASGLAAAAQSGRGLKDMTDTARNAASYILNVKQDLDMLFVANPCTSGLQQQFSENLRRIAYGEPTLQQDAANKVNYAAKDTTVVNKPRTITVACHAKHKADWHQFSKWCRCLNEKFTPMLNPTELQLALDNFNAFENQVTTTPTTGTDGAWRLVSVANSCKNR